MVGSIVAVPDASGQLIGQRTTYEPYGSQIEPSVQDGPGYTGHVRDAGTGSVYMQQRYYDPVTARFISVDPVAAYDQPILAFNRYNYAANNPYKFRDPDGRFIDTIADVGFIAYSGYKLAMEPSWGNAAALGADVLGAAIPGVTGLGTAVRAASNGAGAAKAGSTIAENGARGRASEARVLSDIGDVKNTEVVSTSHGKVIPDFQNATQVGEIKDARRVGESRQIRGEREHARNTGREHVVIVGEATQVAKETQRESTVIRRSDLGHGK